MPLGTCTMAFLCFMALYVCKCTVPDQYVTIDLQIQKVNFALQIAKFKINDLYMLLQGNIQNYRGTVHNKSMLYVHLLASYA